ncbi:MAG: Integrator complex subunit 6 [Marteilia pararefringens]
MLTCLIIDNSISSLSKLSPHDDAMCLLDLHKTAAETILKVKKQQQMAAMNSNNKLSPSSAAEASVTGAGSLGLNGSLDQYYCLMTVADTIPSNIIVPPTDSIATIQTALRSIKPSQHSLSSHYEASDHSSFPKMSKTSNYSNNGNSSTNFDRQFDSLKNLDLALQNCLEYLQILRSSGGVAVQSNDYSASSCGNGRLLLDINSLGGGGSFLSSNNNLQQTANSSSTSVCRSARYSVLNSGANRDSTCQIIVFCSEIELSQPNHADSGITGSSHAKSSISGHKHNTLFRYLSNTKMQNYDANLSLYDKLYHWDQHILIYNLNSPNCKSKSSRSNVPTANRAKLRSSLISSLQKDSMLSVVNLNALVSEVTHLSDLTYHQLQVPIQQVLNSPSLKVKIRFKRIVTAYDDVIRHNKALLSPAQESTPLEWENSVINVILQGLSKSNSSYWPLPETWIVSDSQQKSHPLRESIPTIGFVCKSLDAIHNDQFPFDKFELENSPLTEYIIKNVPPNKCWQLFITRDTYASFSHAQKASMMNDAERQMNGYVGTNLNGNKTSKSSGNPMNYFYHQFSFGYLRTSINQQSVRLFLMPFNYPMLIPLIDDLIKVNKGLPDKAWFRRFENYLQTVPLYYLPYLKTAFSKWSHIGLCAALDSNHVIPELTSLLKEQRRKLRSAFDALNLAINIRQDQADANAYSQNSQGTEREKTRQLYELEKNLRPIKLSNSSMPSDSYNKQMNTLLSANRNVRSIAGCRINMKSNQNSFENRKIFTKISEYDQELLINFELDHLNGDNVDGIINSYTELMHTMETKGLSHMLLHRLPASKATNYIESVTRDTSNLKLREIFPLPARVNMFGNPFKVKSTSPAQQQQFSPSSSTSNGVTSEINKFQVDADLVEDTLSEFNKGTGSNIEDISDYSSKSYENGVLPLVKTGTFRKGPLPKGYKYSSATKMQTSDSLSGSRNHKDYKVLSDREPQKNGHSSAISNSFRTDELVKSIVNSYPSELDTIFSESESSIVSDEELLSERSSKESKNFPTNQQTKAQSLPTIASGQINSLEYRDLSCLNDSEGPKLIDFSGDLPAKQSKTEFIPENVDEMWRNIQNLQILIKQSRSSDHIKPSVMKEIDGCKSKMPPSTFSQMILIIKDECKRYKREKLREAITNHLRTHDDNNKLSEI